LWRDEVQNFQLEIAAYLSRILEDCAWQDGRAAAFFNLLNS
jgi:hypothetical protein